MGKTADANHFHSYVVLWTAWQAEVIKHYDRCTLVGPSEYLRKQCPSWVLREGLLENYAVNQLKGADT